MNESDIINDILKNTSFLENCGNFYLSGKDKEILKRYSFDYTKYNDLKSLIFDIETYLNDSYEDNDELEELSSRIAEYQYYNYTNK